MVHLKDAKNYLKDYYFIPRDRLCFQENDIMMGIRFLDALAKARKQSLVICMSVGNCMGSHSGNSPLGRYLNDVAVLYRRCVVCGTGNEAAARHHFYGKLSGEAVTEFGAAEPSMPQQPGYLDVEVVVEEQVCGFVLEQWALSPAMFQIALISPTGEMLPKISMQLLKSQEYEFPLEGTKVTVDYSMPELTTGNQLIYYRFQTPAPGIWRIRVYPQNEVRGGFHMYLQQQALQCGQVYFLTSNPDVTVMEPGNASRLLTLGGYNQRQKSLFLESGRGYTLDGQLKPDLAAPAVEVEGAVAGTAGRPEMLQYESRTGTSGGAAIGAGAAAMYLQWCEEKGDYRVNTIQVKNFLLRGARTFSGDLYPNRQLGYGVIDLYASFRRL
jgi:hypothetical protein